jgi:hypothetical protein
MINLLKYFNLSSHRFSSLYLFYFFFFINFNCNFFIIRFINSYPNRSISAFAYLFSYYKLLLKFYCLINTCIWLYFNVPLIIQSRKQFISWILGNLKELYRISKIFFLIIVIMLGLRNIFI